MISFTVQHADPARSIAAGVRWRLVRNRFLASLCRTLFWSAVAFGVFVILHRQVSCPLGLGWFALLAASASLVAAAVATARRVPTLLAASVHADEALDLHAGLSTALLLPPAPGPVGEAFRARAAFLERAVRPREAFPFRMPWHGRYLLLPAAVAGLLFFLVPENDLLGWLAKRRRERQARDNLQAVAETFQKRVKHLEKRSRRLSFDGAEQVVADMEAVAAMLERRTLDEKEALERLSKLEETFRDLEDEAESKSAGKALRPRHGTARERAGDLARALQKAIEDGGGRKGLESLAAHLKALRNAFERGLSAEELARRSREIKSVVRDFEMPPRLKELLERLAETMDRSAVPGRKNKYRVPPPELDFTLEELEKLLEALQKEAFLEEALDEIQNARQAMIRKLKLCPYCKKGLKHPWEGGKPLPGMGPGGEPGVGTI